MRSHGAGTTPKRTSAIGGSWIGYSVYAGQGSAVATSSIPSAASWYGTPSPYSIWPLPMIPTTSGRPAPRVSDGLSHGAVPELLRADETFEPFRGCAGILASGRMLLEPLKQAVSIEGRGRRRID